MPTAPGTPNEQSPTPRPDAAEDAGTGRAPADRNGAADGSNPPRRAESGLPASSTSPGSGGRDFWHRPQILIAVIGGALTIVAAVLGLVFDLFPDLKPEPDDTPKVELAGFDVDHEENVRADSTSVLGTKGAARKLKSSVVTVTLRNNGDNPALFTRATFRFSHAASTQCVSGGGDGSLQGLYDIKVPMNRKAPKVERKMRWDLPPHQQETMAFSVGPKDITERYAGILRFTMVLTRDDGTTMKLPSVGHVAPSETLKDYLGGARYVFDPATNDDEDYLTSQQRCWRREFAVLNRITRSTQHNSPELRAFRRDLAAIIPE